MGRILAALLLALLISGWTAHAQQPRARVCAPTNSETTTLAAVAADPAKWMGRCVSVEAIYSGERLFADADAIYGLNPNAIGGYVDGRGDLAGAWRGVFTGRVADCAQAEEDLLTGLLRSPGISLHGRTLGCLRPQGPFLVFMSQSELTPAGLKRRLPGSRGGDLQPAPADWPRLVEIRRVADAFIAGLQADSGEALASLLGNAYVAADLRRRTDTAFAALRAKRPAGPPVVFRYREAEPDAVTAEACWCLKPDCARLWPIAGRDADNQPTRPYACIRLDGRRDGEAWRYRVDASQDAWGLPEP